MQKTTGVINVVDIMYAIRTNELRYNLLKIEEKKIRERGGNRVLTTKMIC